jgi:hypothetical protein
MAEGEIKSYKIFSNEDGVNVADVITKLKQSPYGNSIIAAQIKNEIRCRLGISPNTKNDITAEVKRLFTPPKGAFPGRINDKVYPEHEGKDVYTIWSDGEYSSKTAKQVEVQARVVEQLLIDRGYTNIYFEIVYIPKIGDIKETQT